jgi:hypothetical protein
MLLAEHGPVTWLLDGTTEPGTPVFLGIKEAAHGILLGSWKILSENTEDITACLQQAAVRYPMFAGFGERERLKPAKNQGRQRILF